MNNIPISLRILATMSAPKLQLRRFIEQQGYRLNENAWLEFLEIWEPVEFPRKALITHSGEKEKYLYFVAEGVQRVCFHDEAEHEATLVFTYPPSFAGVLDAFLQQTPSRYDFEALTRSSLLRTDHVKFNRMLQRYPELDRFSRDLLHIVLGGLLERLVELQAFTSEEKFRRLLKRSPHILQHVPQKYLANYLGIDPTNFSKLMNSVKL